MVLVIGPSNGPLTLLLRPAIAVLAAGNTTINRFFALDTRTYEAGALPVKTKELLGLVASMVLRRAANPA